MYKNRKELMTYATTSTNRHAGIDRSLEERCFPDVGIEATDDGCQFWRGNYRMNCTAKFTKDGESGRYDAMNASCQYRILGPEDPMRTHEQILVQAVLGYTGNYGWHDFGYCAVFKVTYLGGFIWWAGDSKLPENERFGSTPYYVLRATSDMRIKQTTCWQKLQEMSQETKKEIKLCYPDDDGQ
nr:uncharacterized protein LOC129385645 isoform X1 [Dermacentor andersoni]